MRYLRLYKNDAVFKTEEQEAGGTGNDVESIVPGIAKTIDERKVYFNPHDKQILFHTITLNYENFLKEQIAQSETIRVKYISGVSQGIVVTPKNIDEYAPIVDKKNVVVPDESSVTFTYSNDIDPSKPLTFKIISGGTIYWKASNASYTKTIQYKKNNNDWVNITSTTGGTSILVNAGDVVQFRGDNAAYCDSSYYYNSFSCSTATKFEVEGNVMSLVDSTGFTSAATLASSYTFCCLFRNCTGLTSAENLVLLAKTLAERCYTEMFRGCTSLTTAPSLPATILAQNCYYNMFGDCTSLTTAPELPATTLAVYCYGGMFQNCSSLTTAPELPATTLADSCYYYMFQGCTSLTTAPELPATTLASYCYGAMFSGCTSLTSAPELPATTLASECYQQMFMGCTSLTSAPSLPATTLAIWCYDNMFYGCTSLTTAPSLPATTLTNYCYYYMFGGCTSLTTAPDLPATTLAELCYHSMFYNCTGLTTAPTLPATTLTRACYCGMFQGCTSLNYIKCLATDISASNCTTNWVNGVAATGTFVKSSAEENWTIGGSGIPTGWITEDYGLVLSVQGISAGLSGGTSVITVTSDDSIWTATTGNQWITLSQNTGNTGDTTISITVSSAAGDRRGSVTFTDGTSTKTLIVAQSDFITQYLTFNVVSGGTIKWVLSGVNTEETLSIDYRKNNTTWTTIASSTGSGTILNVNAGDKIEVRGLNPAYANGNTEVCTFSSFCGSTAWFSLQGNIMSLVVGDSVTGGGFSYSFSSGYVFHRMFRGCTGLTSVVNLVLPVTILTTSCYEHMFAYCINLKDVPDLPATVLATRCYKNMFSNSHSITSIPNNYLPVTKLAYGCYESMFSECHSLSNAAKLPATQLVDRCYAYTFHRTNIVTAPELPAKVLYRCSYYGLFSGCSRLNYVKCLATDIYTSEYTTQDWLAGVSSSGTFVKDPAMTRWPSGKNGIPNGWAVYNNDQ